MKAKIIEYAVNYSFTLNGQYEFGKYLKLGVEYQSTLFPLYNKEKAFQCVVTEIAYNIAQSRECIVLTFYEKQFKFKII